MDYSIMLADHARGAGEASPSAASRCRRTEGAVSAFGVMAVNAQRHITAFVEKFRIRRPCRIRPDMSLASSIYVVYRRGVPLPPAR
ncbi:hypothetical protein [Thauera humireducens]|uniref:hypothetical protein n=1 Tax=Thauera humireducens TaxID=1134435 RepID=UPI00311F53B1